MIDEEAEAIKELKALPNDKLMLVPHTRYKLQCAAEGCKKYWNVYDFGISPFFLIRKRWYDLSGCNYYCGQHFKQYTKIVDKQGTTIERLIAL